MTSQSALTTQDLCNSLLSKVIGIIILQKGCPRIALYWIKLRITRMRGSTTHRRSVRNQCQSQWERPNLASPPSQNP